MHLNPSSSEPTPAFYPCRSTPWCADLRLLVCSYVFTGEVTHFPSVSLLKFCGHSLLCFCSSLQATVQHLTPNYLFLIKRSYHILDFWNWEGWASGSALYCFPWRHNECVYTFLWGEDPQASFYIIGLCDLPERKNPRPNSVVKQG